MDIQVEQREGYDDLSNLVFHYQKIMNNTDRKSDRIKGEIFLECRERYFNFIRKIMKTNPKSEHDIIISIYETNVLERMIKYKGVNKDGDICKFSTYMGYRMRGILQEYLNEKSIVSRGTYIKKGETQYISQQVMESIIENPLLMSDHDVEAISNSDYLILEDDILNKIDIERGVYDNVMQSLVLTDEDDIF